MFERVFAWDGHKFIIAGVAFSVMLAHLLPAHALIPSLIASALIAISLTLLLVVPYSLILLLAVLSLSLLQAMREALRRSNPVTHSFPIR